ncbi:hypothetical protein N7499_008148 [Penicillium canescens]|nr:hypothetical protein N7499_008148 [Penicillium canescens]
MSDRSDHWKIVLIVVPIVATGTATAFYLLRIYSRIKVLHGLRAEDILMGAGLICTYGVASCIVYSAFHVTWIGGSIWSLPAEERLDITLSNWILTKFWPPAQVFVKVSIVILLRRLLGAVTWFRRAATGVIVFVVAWGITGLIGNIFQCWPVQYFWIKNIEGHCMAGQTTFFIIIGSLSTVENVVIVLLPLPVVWRLQMPLQEKIELTFLFTVGFIVCVFSVLRIIQLKNYHTDDLTYGSALSLVFAILELNTAIICGSLIVMKPVFRSCVETLRRGITKLSRRRGGGAAYRPREYQLEMLDASRKENIIIAMDTGSGKTHIAVLRMLIELETCPPDKMIWFLVPTVALALQQHDVISRQIPSVKTKVLTGLDNVELWTEQSIWNEVLQDVRVAVATHAILSDALTHGFVKMSQIALLVFDEAHHCMRRHPANKIMQNHYHPMLKNSGPAAVPQILGLTASPIVRSDPKELETIEANLNAVCKTPKVHRSELLENTHHPQLERIDYYPCIEDNYGHGSRFIRPLLECYLSYNIQEDPYIEALREEGKTLELQKVLESGKTYCNEQLRKFVEASRHIYEELGGAAVDYYIGASIDHFRNAINDSSTLVDCSQLEKVHLLELLDGMPLRDTSIHEANQSSHKLEKVIEFLVKVDQPEFSGLILSNGEQLLCAAYVGWSTNRHRKESLGDLLHRDMQRDTLDEFKAGRKNLIVTTDVLEEGIDMSSCSLVICFDKPGNVKSFVQRRGRARHQKSTYAMMISMDDMALDLPKWVELEQAMIQAYQDDQRLRREALQLENIDETVSERLFIEKTHAVLTANEAIQHLHHFCSVLPVDEYVDNRPLFSFEENVSGLKRATVTLPSSVHPAVRRAQGRKWWLTERAARKETAFHAYRALYEYGLVNDNLLPLTRKAVLRFADKETLPSMVDALEQYDPLVDIAHGWTSGQLYETRLRVDRDGSVDPNLAISMILPFPMPMPSPITLYLEVDTTLFLSFDQPVSVVDASAQTLNEMRKTTALYLQAPSSRERGPERDFVVLFAPSVPCQQLQEWLNRHDGRESSLDLYHQGNVPSGIIRDHGKFTEPRTFVRWIVPGQITKSTPVEVECRPLPRRRNLLQMRAVNMDDGDADSVKRLYTMPASAVTVDKLPLSQAIFGLFISAILDRFQASLVAHRLNDTILKGVGIRDISHVITAISTPIAQATTNYQRYEFFGDSVLKFTVSCQLFFRNTNWHEGYLSESRDKLIQNSRLARAALDTGIDMFILTDRFTPRRWTAPLISNKKAQPTTKRRMSTKVLADVIESLIGAAYMDGGIHKAQACLHRFLPEITLFTSEISPAIVPAGKGVSNIINQHRLANLIGYTFNDPALLTEALTHPSCEYDLSTQSYQRLEFLGDAVLDMLVMAVFPNHPVEMDQGAMTILKHSVVNANLLAFLCMDLAVYEESPSVTQFATDGRFSHAPRCDQIHLYLFLRSHGPNIRDAREACVQRYHALRDQIRHALNHAAEYPWELFARLAADKFFSDIIESVLGAMFVDSGGNLDVCNSFIERLGLLSYVRRVIADGVNVVHPRNIAQSIVKGAGTLVFKKKRIEVKGQPATYRCSAIVNKDEIALVEGCASAEEAEVKVALDVIERLKVNPLVKAS